MKGLWGKVIGGAVGAVGVALIGHIVVNGELPVWLSKVVASCVEFAIIEVPIPAWIALSAVTLMTGGAFFLAYTCLKQIRESDSYTDELKAEYRKLRSHCETLEKSNSELKSANADLQKTSTKLMQDIKVRPSPKEQVEYEIPALAFKLLTTIAEFTDANIRPTLSTIRPTLNVGNVETQAAIDVLSEQRMLSLSVSHGGVFYEFTPKGRAYYLKHK